ncbi:zinc ribbon domain-containing protein [Arthrobacter sp. JSM 101049]|uniref:zinc ribbon domain-containing protein n=1 Tax=Arthrobacter sp. JSM 101049 TaxID=929097 RepID=UPI003561B25F
MAKATPAEQLLLLDLQGLDSKIVKIDRAVKALASDPEIAAATAAATEAEATRREVAEEYGAAQQALTDSEHQVEKVQARIDKDRAQIDAGRGTARDMMALQHEIDSLTQKRGELETTELELMEAAEEVSPRLEGASAAADGTAAQLAQLERARDERGEEFAGERNDLVAQRTELAGRISAPLLALYEKRLAQHGIGAARLYHGTSEGSGMQLAPGDLAEIRAAAEDDVVYCPDSGAILVRSPEWA